MNVGDKLGFAEAGSGTDPDVRGEVVAVHEDGGISVWFGGGSVMDFAPGVIEQGLASGTIVLE